MSRASFTSRVGDGRFALALLLVALAPRLYVALAWSREPVWDGHYYHYAATRIAAGFGYGDEVLVGATRVLEPWSHYPVGYPAVLGALYALFGASPLIGPLLGAVAGALTALFVHQTALPALGATRARVAGALVALHPGLVGFSALVMAEPLAALLLAFAAWLTSRPGRPLLRVALGGACIGLATLVRPASLLVAPALTLLRPARPLWSLERAAVALGCALLVVAPWSVRNCTALDGCALVSTNGGWNLMIGASTSTGRFETLHAADGCPLRVGPKGPEQVGQDRCWSQRALERIGADPLAWLARAPSKLAQTFDHESFPVEYLGEARPELFDEGRRQLGRTVLGGAHRALLVVAALAVVRRPRREERLLAALTPPALAWLALLLTAWLAPAYPVWPFALMVVAVPLLRWPGRAPTPPLLRFSVAVLGSLALTHVVFFGEDRYHVVAVPFLALLAAGALHGQDRAGLAPSRPSPTSTPAPGV